MYGLAVTNDGRLDFDRIFADGHDAIVSKFTARIHTWIGEFEADLRAGIDAELLIGSLTVLDLAAEEIARVAREIPEVNDVQVTKTSGGRYPTFEVLLNNGGAPVEIDLSQFS